MLKYLPLFSARLLLKNIRPVLWLLLAGVSFWAVSCRKNHMTANPRTVIAKGTRLLGLHLSIFSGENYQQAYTQARQAGVDCIPFTLHWSEAEHGGVYDPQGLLGDLQGFYASRPVTLSLCVSPIIAAQRDLPADIAGRPFDDSVVIARFNKLLDTIHQKLSLVKLTYLLIGNEADLYFSLHPAEWPAYTGFCQAVRQHARVLWGKGLKVGAETTLGAAIATDHDAIQSLNSSMDIVGVTYYPLADNFTMLPLSSVDTDLGTLINDYGGRQVILQECGYATSAICAGSEALQAAFVSKIFGIWDQHADRLDFVAFLWLNDLSETQATAVADQYGITTDPPRQTFIAYVRTLGLCNYDGTPKAGFKALVQESSARGWK